MEYRACWFLASQSLETALGVVCTELGLGRLGSQTLAGAAKCAGFTPKRSLMLSLQHANCTYGLPFSILGFNPADIQRGVTAMSTQLNVLTFMSNIKDA